MQSFLAKAESNAVAALKINDKTAVAYDVLIGIATLNGDEESKDKIIKKSFRAVSILIFDKSILLMVKTAEVGRQLRCYGAYCKRC